MAKSIKKENIKLSEKLDSKTVELLAQPEYQRLNNPVYNSLSVKDSDIYDKMAAVYKQLCDEDMTFSLAFVLPDSNKETMFYRIGNMEKLGVELYNKRGGTLMWSLYAFLDVAKYLDFMENMGWIKKLRSLIKKDDIK
jgi:hypothetical protein